MKSSELLPELPVILLPGMMCDARLFAAQTAMIGTTHCTIPRLDQHNTITNLAAEVLHHAPARFFLAGLSMGGIIAMEMLRQAPQRAVRLCLMDTNPLAETTEVQHRREPQIAKVLAGALNQVMRDEMKPLYLADPGRIDILDTCLAMAQDLGTAVFVRQSRALQSRLDQCDTLRQYTGKTLILHGVADRLCPPYRHTLMHSLMPHATYKVIPDAGHLPTLENPEATNSALADWLERN